MYKNETTPAPWDLELEYDGPHPDLEDASPAWRIAADYTADFGWLRLATVPARDSEDAANARLMASAPDLLKALEDLESVAKPGADPLKMFIATEQARAAIAKARGRV